MIGDKIEADKTFLNAADIFEGRINSLLKNHLLTNPRALKYNSIYQNDLGIHFYHIPLYVVRDNLKGLPCGH